MRLEHRSEWLGAWPKTVTLSNYRLGMVNLNVVNLKFHLDQAFFINLL